MAEALWQRVSEASPTPSTAALVGVQGVVMEAFAEGARRVMQSDFAIAATGGGVIGAGGAPSKAAMAPPTPPTAMPMPVVQRMPFTQPALAGPRAPVDPAFGP